MKSNPDYLTPKRNFHEHFTTGNAIILLQGVSSENAICFKSPTRLYLEIKSVLNGSENTETININNYVPLDSSEPKFVEFPLKHIAFDSYFKITVIDKSKEPVEYKLFLIYKWASNK